MPEFIGSPNSIAVQKRIRARGTNTDEDVNIVNGGRILHFLDPESTGWSLVCQYAEEDKLAGFPVVTGEQAISKIHAHLGKHWRTPVWLALLGNDDKVLSACRNVIDSVGLPDDWRVVMHDVPTDTQIAEIQALNVETGVSPYPAYFMRSEVFPVLTGGIYDSNGKLVATASVANRYHPDSRLGGHVFAGMVSVLQECRGKGLGKLINALVLTESQGRFGWRVATEQVSPDNPVSLAMIKSCGLEHSEGLVTVAAINSKETVTR